MKKTLLLLTLLGIYFCVFAQVDEYQRYRDSIQRQINDLNNQKIEGANELQTEYADFRAKQNAEFADFVAKEWKLFEDFKAQELAMVVPKIKEAPTAKPNDIKIEAPDIEYKEENKLPAVTHTTAVEGATKNRNTGDSYCIRTRLETMGPKELSRPSSSIEIKNGILEGSKVSLNFYGRKVTIPVDEKLKIKSKGVKESEVADYFTSISKLNKETSALWGEIDRYVNDFGLNDWGHFCMLRLVSETMFVNVDDRVLFCFYMLRNEGGYKVKVARGKDSNKLTLLLALDNNKDVYSYVFFRFKDGKDNNKTVKYYAVYGGGNADESIYSYDFCSQDETLKQVGLDFDKTLNLGNCDVNRKLILKKQNIEMDLPYNSSHIAYLNDVPMTVFPIYFTSPISIEAQRVLFTRFEELKKQYTPVEFIGILLNFVQTAFDYKTDEEQFGYEKYFYPEEVIGYPYSDCEDRSALFSWLVTTFTNANVIGLQYEGHIATAVFFGDDAKIDGDAFGYAGKKYYVCDPTYINASIGMTMPQFKGVTPKVIKLRTK